MNHDQSGYPIIPDREDYETGFGELVERCEVCERINCICPIDNGLSQPTTVPFPPEQTGEINENEE